MTRRAPARWLGAVVVALLCGHPLSAAAQDEAAAFFDDGVVHEIRLMVNSRDWQTLKAAYDTDQYYPADLEWRGMSVANVGIRSRGNGSRSGVKPGLRVDVNRYAAGQAFLGLRSFVLRNNVQDASQLRERVSMRLFTRLGLPAPREAHARLYVNHAFVGLYTIVESIDRDFLRQWYDDSDGYLYDYDYGPDDAPYYFEDRGTDGDRYVPRPFKPETHDGNPRPDVIQRLVAAINSPGAAFRQVIDDFIDLSTFVRVVAAEVFLGEKDGILGEWGMNNFYLYRESASTRFTIVPWDKSQTFPDGPHDSIWRDITGRPAESRNRLMERILEHADLRETYLGALAAVSASAAARDGGDDSDDRGWLEREVDRIHEQIAASVHADSLKPHTNEEFDAAIRDVRLFARERAGAVNAELDRARERR